MDDEDVETFYATLANLQQRVPRRTAAQRLAYLQTLHWPDHQLGVFNRADWLRSVGASRQAARLVARECPMPSNLQHSDLADTVNLDVARWYASYVGQPWDGSAVSFRRERNRATEVRRVAIHEAAGSVPPPSPWNDDARLYGVRAFRTCQLLVEPLDGHPKLQQLRDYTQLVGWPTRLDVGHLDWQGSDPNSHVCVYCGALLLPSEIIRPRQTVGVVCGQHCCSKGYVCKSTMCHANFLL